MSPVAKPTSALICHAGDELNENGIARWLASFSDLRVLVRIHEPLKRRVRRLKREVQRVGPFRFLDVTAFRIVHAMKYGASASKWYSQQLQDMANRFEPAAPRITLDVPNANVDEVVRALRQESVDFALARCKQLLARRVFEIPRKGVFVLHPGVCPEYRNAHGGFWAIARDDRANVGTTLLRIDAGVDTGPIFGYFRAPFDELIESHLVIQDRTLLANLDSVRDRLVSVLADEAVPMDTSGRSTGEWGQPWLSAWLAYRRRARIRNV